MSIQNTYEYVRSLIGNRKIVRYKRKWRISGVGPGFIIGRIASKSVINVLTVLPDTFQRTASHSRYSADAINTFTILRAYINTRLPRVHARLIITDQNKTFNVPLPPYVGVGNDGRYVDIRQHWKYIFNANTLWEHTKYNSSKLAADLVYGRVTEGWDLLNNTPTESDVIQMIVDAHPRADLLASILNRSLTHASKILNRCRPEVYGAFVGRPSNEQKLRQYELELQGFKKDPHPKKRYAAIKHAINQVVYRMYYD